MRALGWTLAAAVALGALVGCDRASSADPAPTPTAARPTTAAPAPVRTPDSADAQGLTVRYLDQDGTIKTIEPKDFKH